MQADEHIHLIIQQVHEGYHTVADVAKMKREHEQLYGVTLDDPSYVGLCKALSLLQQEERINAMSDVMVAARRANEDIGEVLVVALHAASDQLGNIEALVAGRPGSWEADIVRRMASALVGSHDVKRYAPYTRKLAPLFVKMGEAKEDGGDVLSQAMGKAVNELGGLDLFAGGSYWYHDLINIGCQYSDYPYPMGGNDIKG